MRYPIKPIYYISTALSLVISCAVFGFVLAPQALDMYTTYADTNEQARRIEALYDQGQVYEKVKNDLKTADENIARMGTVFLPLGSELEYIGTLEEKAAARNVTLRTTLGSEASKNTQSGITTIGFTIEASGEWNSILAWLRDVESFPYYTNAETATASLRTATKSGITTHTAVLTLPIITYWSI